MNKFSASVFAILVSTSQPLAAKQISIADVKEMQSRVRAGEFSALAEWNGLTYYLQGVVEGIASANRLTSSGRPERFFCPPKGKGYSLEEVFTLLREVEGKDEQAPLPEVLLSKFIEKFPC